MKDFVEAVVFIYLVAFAVLMLSAAMQSILYAVAYMVLELK